MVKPSPLHNVGGWIQRWARTAGGRLAVADSEHRLDYRALEERCARLAGWLSAGGVGRGDRVALLLGNRSATLEAVFAAARLGAIALPINTRLTAREIRFLLDDCSPSALLYEDALAERVGTACGSAAAGPRLRLPVGGTPDEYERALARAQPLYPVAAVLPDDPMMLMYTSGTTGQPKGALLPHRKTLFNTLNAQIYFGTRADDRVLVVSPLFHSLGLLILSLPALYCGAAIVLQPRFDPEAVWRSVALEGITTLGGVPTLYQQLLDALPDAARAASLRFLFTAGAAVGVDLVRAYADRGLPLVQGYGQTESSILCCLDVENALRKAGSVGRPVFHVDLRCVDRSRMHGLPADWAEVSPDETGELVARGPILMLGYWQQPDATAETLRGEWLRTGDLARIDREGFVTLVGRAREMWISGGENVYPAEVEAVYAEHPSVQEIAVVGVADAKWGEVGRAHVVLADGHRLDPDALRYWGRERLAAFKLPTHFVEEEALPRTASGKVRKSLLEAPEPGSLSAR